MKMESQIRLISVDDILPNRFQPRLKFDENALNELADSIREHGIIQPLVLRRLGNKYEIIAGERRYKASQLVGLGAVPAIIADINDNESAEVAIIENTQRRNLSAIEEAKSYKKLLDRKYLTQDQLAKRMGVSQSSVANKLRLLNLDPEVQQALVDEKISERHARSMLKVEDFGKQKMLLNKTIAERWTVKKLDEEIENLFGIVDHEDIAPPIDFKEVASNYSNDTRVNSTNQDSGKNVALFNNLEQESVNMDTTTNLAFNPFATVNNSIPEFEEIIDEEVVEKKPTESNIITSNLASERDVKDEIKKILKIAKDNDVNLKVEEFDFQNTYQFVIRIGKE